MKGTRVLRHKAFRAYLLGRFSLVFAIQIQAICIALQVYDITHDAFSLGLTGLAEALPFMAIVLPAGYWADRYSRKRLILISTSLLLCTGLLLFVFSLPGMIASNRILWILYGVTGITGIARGISGPSVQATLANILPREELAEGVAWNTSFWQTASISGPAIGGILYAALGSTGTYLVSSTFSFMGVMAFTFIPKHRQALVQVSETLWEKLTDGLRFVFQSRLILSALSLDMLAVLFGGAVALLPLFADQVLHTDAQGLGILRAAPSIGALITSLILARNPPMNHSGRLLLLCVGLFGVSIIGFALSEFFWLSFILLMLSGAFDGVSVLIRSTIVQLFTPDEKRGRVSSVNSVFIGSSNEIGAFESGMAAKLMGLVPSVIFGGCMTLGVTGWMAWKSPKLRKLELKHHVKQ